MVSKRDLLKIINLYVTVKMYEKVFIQQNLLLYEQHSYWSRNNHRSEKEIIKFHPRVITDN